MSASPTLSPTSTADARGYHAFMAGSLVGRIGDWLDLVALNWATLQLTDSALHLALINVCRLAPVFALSVPAGVLADRYDRRRLLMLIQVLSAALTVLLGLMIHQHAAFWAFALVVTVRACLSAMDAPVRNALLPNLAPSDRQAQAVALNAAQMNLARVIGPAIAGAVLAVAPALWLFALNAASSLVALASLAFVPATPQTARTTKSKGAMAEALAFVRAQPTVQSLLILAIAPMVFGFPYTAMLPLFVRDLTGLGPTAFGGLLTVSAVGSLVGSGRLAFLRDQQAAGKWLIVSLLGFGLSLGLFMVSKGWVPAAIAMFLVGLTSQTYRTTSRIALQAAIPDALRGRILSIALMDRGFIPLGTLLVGAIATQFGTGWAGATMALGSLAVTGGLVVLRPEIWRLAPVPSDSDQVRQA
ncbi:MFS transporter [bacterium]|nr:MFS transporter [bacterium]